MGSQDDEQKIEIQELIGMCKDTPDLVTMSKRAVDESFKDFNLDGENEVKIFIGDGNLENLEFKGCSKSDRIQGVVITVYHFNSGKPGYLAYHRNAKFPEKVHIKSFHKNDSHPKSNFSTLGDFFSIKIKEGSDE